MMVLLALFTTFLRGPTVSAETAASVPKPLVDKANAAIDLAIDYLRKNQQADGGYGEKQFGPPITALVTTGVLRSGRLPASDPMITKSLDYLKGFVKEDGGIYAEGGQENYGTAITLLAFAAANKDGKYQKIIDGAVKYLKEEQWDEAEGAGPENPKFGGAGYGSKSRPDLSNTSFMLEALDAANLPKDDPAYQRAIVFIRRCQNLSGEGANDLPFGDKINDGGFYYTPIDDTSPGGGNKTEGLRSYGSMTYAGLKSFIYAGLDKDDFRVKAANDWIKRHYTVSENPGMDQQGLYYYYQTFAKALALLQEDELVDSDGQKHNWRVDLIEAILAKQKPDGSWSNETTRWLEGEPKLVTAYVLLALDQALHAPAASR
jgi:squalene-hopene/tetraprenyl-beta-curcumene cyclase